MKLILERRPEPSRLALALAPIAAILFTLAVCTLLVAWAGRGAWQSLARLSWPHALLAAVCVAAYNLSFFAGVKAVGVGLGTAVAIGSGPIWAGLMQTVLQRRWPTPVWWAGTLLGVAHVINLRLNHGHVHDAGCAH